MRLTKSRVCKVFNIAWGQDIGDPEFHITTNVSPSIPGSAIDFFFTDEVVEIAEGGSGRVLFGRHLTSA